MTHKPKLLIVDDDAKVRELAEFAAHRTDLFEHVATSVDGLAAFEWLSACADAELPDVILTDLSMPRLNGLDLTRRLRETQRLRDIPVAMFSSSNHPDDEEQARAAGCRQFFVKPAGVTDLEHILATVAALVVHTPHHV